MNRRSRRHHAEAEISTESLNDIMFFLLLFFLIVSTIANPNVIKLLLPNSKTTASMAKQPISVSITSDLRYFINKKPTTLEGLEQEIISETKGMENPTVVVRVDKDVNVQNLVDVLQIGNKLKIKMVLATAASKI